MISRKIKQFREFLLAQIGIATRTDPCPPKGVANQKGSDAKYQISVASR